MILSGNYVKKIREKEGKKEEAGEKKRGGVVVTHSFESELLSFFL